MTLVGNTMLKLLLVSVYRTAKTKGLDWLEELSELMNSISGYD